jgi:hypothetical protein
MIYRMHHCLFRLGCLASAIFDGWWQIKLYMVCGSGFGIGIECVIMLFPVMWCEMVGCDIMYNGM